MYIQEHLFFYIQNIHINYIREKEYKMHILYHEQAVCGRGKKKKWKKAYLMRESTIAMWLYHSLADSETHPSSSKNRGKKRSRMGVWDCHMTSHEASNGYTYSLGEIIIYYLPMESLHKPSFKLILSSTEEFFSFKINKWS